MTDVSAHTPVFSRGSTVLDYWLAHAEGLTVEPLGARVEHVVLTPPAGRAQALIVRSRMTRRRKAIPAEAIAAVDPSAGQLLLEPRPRRTVRLPRPTPEQRDAARATAAHAGRVAHATATGAARSARSGTVTTLVWLRPRAARIGLMSAQQARVAAGHTARGTAWLLPRVVTLSRLALRTAVRLTLAGAALATRAAAIAMQRARRYAHERWAVKDSNLRPWD